jgi:hypothetical protein
VPARLRIPDDAVPIRAYFTDGRCLVQVLESSPDGVLAENVVTFFLISIEPSELKARWRRVTPA